MRHTLFYLFAILLLAVPAGASHPKTMAADRTAPQTSETFAATPEGLFRQHIPFIAEQFIGMPVKLGGLPARTGSTDNSSLFYSIYASAAQKAGLVYKAWLPMAYLLANTHPISRNEVRNGDLIVLENGLAAMIYKTEAPERLHMIYASEKRQQVFSFHTDNLVYQVYWLEHLKGFFRLKPDMLRPVR